MKIYFCGSIVGGRADVSVYAEIIKHLKQYGSVITDYVGNSSLTDKGESLDPVFIYKRDMEWFSSADLVVAEVTQPSLGVGYELARAEFMKKPLLCLYRPSSGRQLSSIVRGNPVIKVVQYELPEISDILKSFFESFKG